MYGVAADKLIDLTTAVLVPVANLLDQVHNPVVQPPWFFGPNAPGPEVFLHNHVMSAICEYREQATFRPVKDMTIRDHAERIAHFVFNGWDDAITIDMGIPGMMPPGWVPCIEDGNHRLYAAVLRGETHIRTEISGAVDYAVEMLGIQ